MAGARFGDPACPRPDGEADDTDADPESGSEPSADAMPTACGPAANDNPGTNAAAPTRTPLLSTEREGAARPGEVRQRSGECQQDQCAVVLELAGRAQRPQPLDEFIQ